MENREGVNLALFKRNAVCLSALVKDRKVNLSKGFLFLDQRFLKMIINFDSNEGQARAHTQTCLPLYFIPWGHILNSGRCQMETVSVSHLSLLGPSLFNLFVPLKSPQGQRSCTWVWTFGILHIVGLNNIELLSHQTLARSPNFGSFSPHTFLTFCWLFSRSTILPLRFFPLFWSTHPTPRLLLLRWSQCTELIFITT